MPGRIVVRGDGVAALCCSRLLREAGLSVGGEGLARAKLPAIMLSERSQKLLSDIFERQDLFDGLHSHPKTDCGLGPRR